MGDRWYGDGCILAAFLELETKNGQIYNDTRALTQVENPTRKKKLHLSFCRS